MPLHLPPLSLHLSLGAPEAPCDPHFVKHSLPDDIIYAVVFEALERFFLLVCWIDPSDGLMRAQPYLEHHLIPSEPSQNSLAQFA